MNLPLDEIELPSQGNLAGPISQVSSDDVVKESRRNLEFEVTEDYAGNRIDLYLTFQLDGYSRVFLRKLVAEDQVLVDGRAVKPAFKVQTGQKVTIDLLPPPPEDGPVPEPIPLSVIYEDEGMVVINKPPAMVVHPAKGHWSGTLTAALAHHFSQLSDAGGACRPGIVHRLDRDTSGVIAIAKTNEVHFKLCAQFEAREVKKTYYTIVNGTLDRDRDWIHQPIGHHPYQREKMSIRAGHASSRDASSFFEVKERFPGYALIEVQPKTGRTHQIRLHMAHIRCPVICDRLYGGQAQVTRGQLLRRLSHGLPARPGDEEVIMSRQALHAYQLELNHPVSGERMTFTAPLPDDFERVLSVLREQRGA